MAKLPYISVNEILLITYHMLIQSVRPFCLIKSNFVAFDFKQALRMLFVCMFVFLDGVVLIDPDYVKDRKVFGR